MSSVSERLTTDQTRTYDRASSVVFLKTDEPFGGLSNMAGGFPLHVQGTRIHTSEALYQACRFPHLPEAQHLIIALASPMTAKMKSKSYRKDTRPDWERVRVRVMRWCLRVKLAQNWAKLSELLLRTGDRSIVEESRKDDFWGAKSVDERTLVGRNVLGRLLMELREAIKSRGREALQVVEPPDIPEFLLFGRPIEAIGGRDLGPRDAVASASHPVAIRPLEQAYLFNEPAAREAPAPACAVAVAPERGLLGGLKPYPGMRDSGVPWLGEVPEHWTVLPNRAVFTEIKERNHPNADMLSVTIAKGVVRQRALLEDTSKKDSSNLDKTAYKLVRPGDIAYNKMRAWQGAVGMSEYHGIVSPAYVVQRPHESADPRYLHYLLRTPAFAKEAERWSYGITSDMWSLRPEHFKMIYSCLPPLSEQAAIVCFLDYSDRRMRRYIRAKQKLIKLLEEQKQAVIRRAVTRGLDPNVRVKPSCVEWLGDVPVHWEVSRVKTEFLCLNRRRVPLSGTERGSMTLRRFDYYGASGVIDKVDDYLFDDELLLIAEDGANLVLRNLPLAIIARGKFWVNNHAHILKPKRGNLEYLAAVMESINYRPWISGAAQPKLTQDRLMGIAIAVAPREEQDSIVDWIGEETVSLQTTIERCRREISLLREYRTRLIADVVTGELDVREAAARLPDEAEESEPREEADFEDDVELGADDIDQVLEEAEA